MQRTVRKPSLFEKPIARDNDSFNSYFVKVREVRVKIESDTMCLQPH